MAESRVTGSDAVPPQPTTTPRESGTPESTSTIEAGHRVGDRYRLVERLAWGGMGEVWRAHDEQIERDVAVKLLRDDLAADASAVERFRREARTAASFSHPNVASVFDVVNGGRPGIVMELVRGETLGHAIRNGPLPTADVLMVADGLLAALDAAHAAGVVHRDVTPGNVLLAPQSGTTRVKVTDFGIARTEQDATTRLTDTGTVIGTAQYLAPEQLEDAAPTPLSDQYAAALVIYEALAGTLPFEGTTPAAAALARLQVPPVPLSERAPDVPAEVAQVVMRGLERDPSRRHESVAAMRSALHEAAAAAGLHAGATFVATPASAGAAVTEVASIPSPSGLTTPLTAASSGPPGTPQPPEVATSSPRRRVRSGVLFLLALALAVVASGWAVARVNGGPAVIDVPTFAGMALTDAEAAAEELGLRVETATVDDPSAEGTVLSQTIPAGAGVEAGTLVGLEVSSGVPPCCTVPDLLGQTDADAIAQTVGDTGLTMGTWTERESEFERGTVLEQTPAAGATVERGTAMNFVVSAGPPEDDDEKGKGRREKDDD